MGRVATLLVLSILLLAIFPYAAHQGKVFAAVNCCQYAIILSEIEPRPGESVGFTGIVTDQYGAAEPGVQVHYHQNGLDKNVTTDSSGIFQFSLMIPQNQGGSIIGYTVSMNDSSTKWHDSVTDAYAVSSGAQSGNLPVLYYNQWGGRGSYISLNSPKEPAIIYVGGGYESEYLHGATPLDSATLSFLDYLKGMGFNVIAPAGWAVTGVPSFPLVIGALLKHGFAFSKVYLLGWSAGGVASAWALTRDFSRVFDLAVIMDAELTGPSENATKTDYSVFSTAQFAGQVGVPHLLIYGKDDTGAIGVQTAAQWVSHAQFGLTRLDPLPYSHTWLNNSVVESTVRDDLITFYTNASVGANFSANVGGNSTIRITVGDTNGSGRAGVRSASYNPSQRTLSIATSGQSGGMGVINLVVPISLIDGEPAATIDNSPIDSYFSKVGGYYYIFLTYPGGPHTILVGGKNTIPEFPYSILILMLVIIATLNWTKRLRTRAK